jgi:hypothetical protein
VRAALIPPKGYYETALKSDYHLVLAQVVRSDDEYRRMYEGVSSDHYVILDNGAAEGEIVSDDELIRTAVRLGVDEIVLPDVIGDYVATISRAEKFLDEQPHNGAFGFMGVVQGNNQAELRKCIDDYGAMQEVRAIGLPRHLLNLLSSDLGRICLLQYLERDYGDPKGYPFAVHLLGTNPTWPNEIETIAKTHSWVRGVDTSMPYNWAIAKNTLGPVAIVDRPENYFTARRDIDEKLLNENIGIYMGWASGTKGTGS